MPRAKNPVRRGQLIAPFGVASLMVLKNGISVITSGLDAWFKREDGTGSSLDTNEYRIQEWRLERLLHVTHFRLPPEFRERRKGFETPNVGLTAPCLRFPQWHFCQFCNRLYRQPIALKERVKCDECGEKKKFRRLVQVPFIAICDAGHVQDFPWVEWVHGSVQPVCDKPIRLIATGGATLAAQKVVCECGKERSLASITEAYDGGERTYLTQNLDKAQAFTCRGQRPWIADTVGNGCGRPLRGSLRSASNVYFADVRSAIYLPRGNDSVSSDLIKLLEEPPLSVLISFARRASETITPQELRANQGKLLEPFSDEEIGEAIKVLLASEEEIPAAEKHIESDDQLTAFRRAEFDVLRTPREENELVVRSAKLAGYDQDVARHFSRIMLVEKLRETRSLAGFTRVFPENSQTLEQRKAMLWRSAPTKREEWLPAYVVFGEGIFLELHESVLQDWEKREGVLNRARSLADVYRRVQQDRKLRERHVTPRFLLLHSFAHLLINRLTFECGYSSAALRERLFVSDDVAAPMSGVLIYTAAGDAEGTMGGLVRMGKPGYLEPVIRRALEGAQWCSADPVCIEMGSSGGQGPDSCNLAACHNCALIPETACEEFNRFLDRAVLIGEPGSANLGFFTSS